MTQRRLDNFSQKICMVHFFAENLNGTFFAANLNGSFFAENLYGSFFAENLYYGSFFEDKFEWFIICRKSDAGDFDCMGMKTCSFKQ